MFPHTYVFLHNSKALKVDFDITTSELKLWWSPKAGESFDYYDRNFSNRDDHLDVFDSIQFPGLDQESYASVEYDPYHAVIRYKHCHLHIAISAEESLLYVWCNRDLRVDFATNRYDSVLAQCDSEFTVRHVEPSYPFEFTAVMGGGDGAFKHQSLLDRWKRTYAMAQCTADQLLVIGVGLEGEAIADAARRAAACEPAELLAEVERRIEPDLACGNAIFADDRITELYNATRRSLHSCIDDSGAVRAALKHIYYLIWIRDSAFCFCYQNAAGWTHRMAEWRKLLLSNRLELDEPGQPKGKMFAQLINRKFGKLEEDGIFYALWSVFTHWTQVGADAEVSAEELAILKESMDFAEDYIFDKDRGLFGGYFADETPMCGCRDTEGDFAIGKPTPVRMTRHHGNKVVRNYDLYINILMHSSWTMLGILSDGDDREKYLKKAADLWENLKPLVEDKTYALPPYGELLYENGERALCEPYGLASSTYVWGLTMPSFVQIPGVDSLKVGFFADVAANPGGHWLNGICSLIASMDTWYSDEEPIIAMLDDMAKQANVPGAQLPMAGMLMEKYDSPQVNFHGNPYGQDIRPQAFAQSTWLAACTNLGVRRLPFGLAMRSTRFLKQLEHYEWQGKTINFDFARVDGLPLLVVNGKEVPHTLQIPESCLDQEANSASLKGGGAGPLLVRSTVRLDSVAGDGAAVTFAGHCYQHGELVFAEPPAQGSLKDADGAEIAFTVDEEDGMAFVRFTAGGGFSFCCAR